jgi:excisionase family DNA binding protein
MNSLDRSELARSDFVTAAELAKCLKVSIKSVRRWYRQGTLPVYRIGGVPRFHLPTVLKAIQTSGRKGAGS